VEIEAEMDSLKEELSREHEQMKREMEEEKQKLRREAELIKEETKVIKKQVKDKKSTTSDGTMNSTGNKTVQSNGHASTGDGATEILLKRVIKATYNLGPETVRTITYTITG
jgi:F0F1-type ATP synthase membrane subunit b/b'